jgi:hypothetical protein
MYATSFNASNSTALKRMKRIGQLSDYYIQTGPKSASISATVIPITGVGVNQLMNFLALTGDFVSGSFIQVPNYRFEKCFLKSLQFSVEPWKVLALNMQFDSYGVAIGDGLSAFSKQDQNSLIVSPLRGMSISLSTPTFTQTINEYSNLNFNVDVERLPNFEIGTPYPKKVSVSRITKTLQIDGISNADWLSDYEPSTSISATITMPDGNSVSVAGILSEQGVVVDNGSAAKGTLKIVQEMV